MGLWSPSLGSSRVLVHPGGVQIPARRTRGSFAPTTVSGLVFWLDASDISTLWQDSARTTSVTTDADPVGAWDDKSGNGYNFTQATGALRPAYDESVFVSLPALLFDGTSSRLENALAATQKPCTVFAVVKRNTDTTDDAMLGSSASSGFEFRIDIADTLSILKEGVANIGTSTGTVAGGAKAVATVTYSGAGAYAFYLNGASDATGTNDQTLTAGSYRVGWSSSGGEFFSGHIAEIGLYDSVLSAGDLTDLHSYLNSKWAVY